MAEDDEKAGGAIHVLTPAELEALRNDPEFRKALQNLREGLADMKEKLEDTHRLLDDMSCTLKGDAPEPQPGLPPNIVIIEPQDKCFNRK